MKIEKILDIIYEGKRSLTDDELLSAFDYVKDNIDYIYDDTADYCNEALCFVLKDKLVKIVKLDEFCDEDDCFISDHNSMNHSYQYLDFPVSLNQLSNFEYPGSGRKIVINGNFGDRKKITKSLYNVL